MPYITSNFSEKNNCLKGAYPIKVTSHDNKLTIIASGSEVSLALETQELLKSNNIDSKVVSMPCQELFDEQQSDYKDQILEKDSFIVSIEASSTGLLGKIYE